MEEARLFSISGQSLRVLETKFGMLQRNVGCFNEKNKKIRKQKCNKIFIVLLFNLYIYLHNYINII